MVELKEVELRLLKIENAMLELSSTLRRLSEMQLEITEALKSHLKQNGSLPLAGTKRYLTNKEVCEFLGCSYQLIKTQRDYGNLKLAAGSTAGKPLYDRYQIIQAIADGKIRSLTPKLEELMVGLPSDWRVRLQIEPPVEGVRSGKMPAKVRQYVEIGKHLI